MNKRKSSPRKKQATQEVPKCPPVKFAGIKIIDEKESTNESGTVAYLAKLLNRAKYVKFNKTTLESETEKVKLTRKKILNDDELQAIIEDGGILGLQTEEQKFR
jgi:molybdopterin biosynthesis enzyme MoaB